MTEKPGQENSAELNREVNRLRPYIELLSDHLWSHPVRGHAAAFIGAGFSLNANQVSATGRKMLPWSGVVRQMRARLDPGRLNGTAEESAPRVAQELEAAFGRPELDRVIRESIPDTNYEPGRLHQLLLELPWSDIFTTNQDTLLERARFQVVDQRYDVVHTVEDISAARNPRIVKLHGSLNSHRPFVFTEEDFRTYPTKFAPFVNLVQQSMMENVFCLFGFSGDDPNFLYWSGWVRDNLGSHAPKIYLVGVLDISDSKRKLLESRNVIPIDLGALFPASTHANVGQRHMEALEWILLSLRAGRPLDKSGWPIIRPVEVPNPSYSSTVPILTRAGHQHTELGAVNSLKDIPLQRLYEEWRHERETYPGWVTLPGANRKTLRSQTDSALWSNHSSRSIWQRSNELAPEQAMLLLHELVWRLDKYSSILWLEETGIIEARLESINPFPGTLHIPDSEAPETEASSIAWGSSQIDWPTIAEAWLGLAFTLLRTAREQGNKGQYEKWKRRLEPVALLYPKWNAALTFETALYKLSRLDHEGARQTLESWPHRIDLPEWELKRSGLLAELGHIEEAILAARSVVDYARRGLHENAEDVAFLSLESWALQSLNQLLFAKQISLVQDTGLGEAQASDRSEYERRLAAIRAYGCDSSGELERLNRDLQQPMPLPPLREAAVYESYGFDPGSRTSTSTISFHTNYLDELAPAIEMLRLSEDVGYPFRILSVQTLTQARSAAEWIFSISPVWSISSYLRSGNHDQLYKWLTRARIASLTDEHIDALFEQLSNSISGAVSALTTTKLPAFPYTTRTLAALIEVLSRIILRLNEKRLLEARDLMLELASNPQVQSLQNLHRPMSNLVKRIVRDLPSAENANILNSYMDFPYPTANSAVATGAQWPEPSDMLRSARLVTSREEPHEVPNSLIDRLTELVRDGDNNDRWRSLTRLLVLRRLRYLTPDQERDFAEAIWSQVDDESGIPIRTGMTPESVLSFPEVQPGDAKKALTSFLRLSSISPVIRRTESGWSTSGDPSTETLRGWIAATATAEPFDSGQLLIDWTSNDISHLIEQLLDWVRLEPPLAEVSGHMTVYLRDRFDQIDNLLSRTILPRYKKLNSDSQQAFSRFLSQLKNLGFRPIRALPALLFVGGDFTEQYVEEHLKYALSSNDSSAVHRALLAIRDWTILAGQNRMPPVNHGLVVELSNKILLRRDPELIGALYAAANMVKYAPGQIPDTALTNMVGGLEFLLEESTLPSYSRFDALFQQRHVVAVSDRPHVQLAASELANALIDICARNDTQLPNALVEWRVQGLRSPLPEVRSIFAPDVDVDSHFH